MGAPTKSCPDPRDTNGPSPSPTPHHPSSLFRSLNHKHTGMAEASPGTQGYAPTSPNPPGCWTHVYLGFAATWASYDFSHFSSIETSIQQFVQADGRRGGKRINGGDSSEGRGGGTRKKSKTSLPSTVLSRDILTSLARRLCLVGFPLGKAGTAKCSSSGPSSFHSQLTDHSG